MPWIFLTPYEFQLLCRLAHGFFTNAKLLNDPETLTTLSELEQNCERMIQEVQERNE